MVGVKLAVYRLPAHISRETATVVDRDQDNYTVLPDNILYRATISSIIANVKLNDMDRVAISINAIKLHY